MNVHYEIAALRRRYQAGDESARDALQHWLQTYLLLIVRRAARPQNAKSRASRGIRRLAGEERQPGRLRRLPSAADLCRRLCDELLQTPIVESDAARSAETICAVGRTTEFFGPALSPLQR